MLPSQVSLSINPHDLLASLAKRRSVFHSEADFQHALAWELALGFPKASIRLEIQVSDTGQRNHLDLLLKDQSRHIAFELKYKTSKTTISIDDEIFSLRNHGANDVGRYDFLKDIHRIERYVQTHPGSEGFVIFLTNDKKYWKQSRMQDTVDAAFKIDEGRIITGELSWGIGASEGTMKNRKNSIIIKGSYDLKWHDFVHIENQQFRYVVVHVHS